IHPFRLKVKELRYVLQLGEGRDSKLIYALGEVQDQVGLWHDWNQLSGIAAEVLNHGRTCEISAQIHTRTRQEFLKALVSANRLRAGHLSDETSRGTHKKGAIREMRPDMVKAARAWRVEAI